MSEAREALETLEQIVLQCSATLARALERLEIIDCLAMGNPVIVKQLAALVAAQEQADD